MGRKFNTLQIEIDRLKYDINYKDDDVRKLQHEIKILSEFKIKSSQLEEKLTNETVSNKTLTNKITHLENELITINKNLIYN